MTQSMDRKAQNHLSAQNRLQGRAKSINQAEDDDNDAGAALIVPATNYQDEEIDLGLESDPDSIDDDIFRDVDVFSSDSEEDHGAVSYFMTHSNDRVIV